MQGTFIRRERVHVCNAHFDHWMRHRQQPTKSEIRVACLMLTADRRRFIPRAIRCFLEQQYPADWTVNLYVIDDGSDRIADLIPEHDRIHYETMAGKSSIGAKLNFACNQHPADFYITFDDDDFHSPTRIVRQIEPLIVDFELSGTSKIFYHDLETDEGWVYSGWPHLFLGGMAFRRELWERQRFENKSVGVDTHWQQACTKAGAKWFDLADPALLVATKHADNSCPKNTANNRNWKRAILPEFSHV
jgi:glycosyltransferase involved in cell wall biosynthesis